MDQITQYQRFLEDICQKLSDRVPVNKPQLSYQTILDEKRLHFILILTGWHQEEYYHKWIFHVQIKEGKIWILEDMTDPGVKVLLMEKGVPESDIVLAFIPEIERTASISARA